MVSEHWRQVSDLYHAALERSVGDRSAYLQQVCAGDEALRAEVASLLEHEEAAEDFLRTSSVFGTAASSARHPRSLSSGQQLGVYRIESLIGAGGMGEVYRAQDPRLGRDVAIKVLPMLFVEDRDRLQRFEQEARAAAALNHPNILSVFDIGSHDGVPYIVMEFVRGETLAAYLRREQRLTAVRALEIAAQIADALAAAHAAGVVHRDLKPGNIMLTPDGRVKVLDFGLAKILSPDSATTTSLEVVEGGSAQQGRVIGTPAYMPPEQLLGRPVDYRSDIYSFGVILFQMVTGQCPYDGTDFFALGWNSLTLATPVACRIEPSVPPAVSALIEKAMAKVPSMRPASAAEFKSDIERLRLALDRKGSRLRTYVGTTAAAVAIAALAGIGVYEWRASTPPAERPVIAVLPFGNLSGDATKDYLTVGVAETLTTGLARLSSISVVSRETTAESGGSINDLPKLARELGANLLVQGSVQQSGGRIRIDAKLVKPDGTVVWAGDAEADGAQLFSMEQQLTDQLVEALHVTVAPAERAELARLPTTNAQALDAYWQGMARLERNDRANDDRAIESFTRAVEDDPQFALAYAGLGRAYVHKYLDTDDPAWIAKAADVTSKALDLDPGQIEVRLSLANVYKFTARNSAAIEQLRRVLTQQPANDEAHRRLGEILATEGKSAEALAQLQSAVALRPQYWLNHDALGLFMLRAGRTGEAVQAFVRVTELQPDNGHAYQRLGTAYQMGGDKVRARQSYERSIKLEPDAGSYTNLGIILLSEGRFEEAARAHAAAIKLRPNRAIYHGNLGDAYVKLGRTAEAREAYERAARLVERALAINPDDAVPLSRLAVYEAKLGRKRDADVHSARATAINAANPDLLYARAVVLALNGNPSAAITALSDAVARGYSSQLLRDDEDLVALRTLPAFQSLIATTAVQKKE